MKKKAKGFNKLYYKLLKLENVRVGLYKPRTRNKLFELIKQTVDSVDMLFD